MCLVNAKGDFDPPPMHTAPKFGKRLIRNSNFTNKSRGPPHMPNMIKIASKVWGGEYTVCHLIGSLPFLVTTRVRMYYGSRTVARTNDVTRARRASRQPADATAYAAASGRRTS